ncbi:hypothetical protein Ade02nite_40150 [Paractinoplanes deccanensis]|uniref:GAF domain-containing protein n=1 Tax=Paractinoplanes deccanensis TaxID=113561 RepID=A0ABQ3Y5V8_9ACTN|nr:GAF domain-containing protein [Actinoplanes deccanensis]GID75374.1 hypothetical protein Ade02nite_40150 [Actinoplanes deccanensis]
MNETQRQQTAPAAWIPARPDASVADDFLALADRVVVEVAILLAARTVGGAAACDLQIYDSGTGGLRIARHKGFTPESLDYFAAVDPSVPSACGTALVTRHCVLIDDVAASPIFRGRPTLDVMLAVGSRAVHSYPLHDSGGTLLGMLSLHYPIAEPHAAQEQLAWAAGLALAEVLPRGVPRPDAVSAGRR